jgi:hypothetical protein
MVYDMEWIPGQLEVRLLGLYDGDRYRAFHKVDDFLNAVLVRENADKWLYAHYGGMADAQFLLQRLASRADEGFQIDASFSGSSAIIIHVTRGELSWHFIDSFWLLRDRLSKIGEAVGLEKMGEEYACDNFPNCGHVDSNEMKYLDPCSCTHSYGAHDKQPGTKDLACLACGCRKYDGDHPYAMCVFWAPIAELTTYNERDCVILYKAIERFEQTLLDLGGQLQMTIASCAMHLFRRKYLQDDIRTVAAVNGWARKAYTSSRVEVFQTHCENAHYFDLNSSFPFAMTFDCPGNVKKMRAKKLPPYGSIYIAECEIIVPEMYLPPLPFRHDGRVFFPTGTWTSWFSNIDLELLQKRGGRIVKVIQSIEFEKQSSLREYAIDIYAKRKAATTSYEKLILKYLLNSLGGGMRMAPLAASRAPSGAHRNSTESSASAPRRPRCCSIQRRPTVLTRRSIGATVGPSARTPSKASSATSASRCCSLGVCSSPTRSSWRTSGCPSRSTSRPPPARTSKVTSGMRRRTSTTATPTASSRPCSSRAIRPPSARSSSKTRSVRASSSPAKSTRSKSSTRRLATVTGRPKQKASPR